MPSIPEDELEQQIVKCFGDSQYYDGGWFASYDGKWIDITNDVVNLVALFRQYAAKERLDERKQVAFDNYHGHTFSDETNYKYKFDKFIENNERRIKQLKEGE